MSFKLFLQNAFGSIKSTTRFEAEREALLHDYHVFVNVSKSEDLKEFQTLKERVNSATFKKMKADLKALKFKGSPEEVQLKQFNKLDKNSRLKKYYAVAGSAELKRYESLKEGTQLDRYFELEEVVEKGFSKDDKNAKEIKAEFKKLKTSPDVVFLHQYQKSSAFRNYVKMQNSADKKKYEELKELVAADEFKQRKAYLEDSQKWEKTPEYAEEKRYLELKGNSEIELYFKYKDSNAFDFFKTWNVVFDGRFKSAELDSSKWKTINPGAEKTVGRNFSQDGDLHAFANGKNIHLKDSKLMIQVKKDKINSLVWKPFVGFIEQEFDYSSDLLTSGGLFEAQYGLLEAKVKLASNKNIQDVFSLCNENNSVRLNLLESGHKKQVGLSQTLDGKTNVSASSIGGLSSGKFYVFRMEWKKGQVTWKVNGKELFSVNSNVPDEPMHLFLTSLVIHETNDLPHNFETEWVRFYQKGR